MTVLKVDFCGKTMFYENGVRIDPIEELKMKLDDIINGSDFENQVTNFFKRFAVPASFGLGTLSTATHAFAAGTETIGEKLKPLIQIVQDLALPVGIVVASWGLLEVIMGNFPSGKEKIKYAIIGFVGMFIIPEVFYAISSAFRTA